MLMHESNACTKATEFRLTGAMMRYTPQRPSSAPKRLCFFEIILKDRHVEGVRIDVPFFEQDTDELITDIDFG